MNPARLTTVIRRGLYWPGMVMRCYKDAGKTELTDLTGWQPQMQARVAPQKDVIFTFVVTLGEGPGEVQMQPVEAAQTLELPVGKLIADLVLLTPDGKPVGPYARLDITVEDTYTRP